MSLSFGLFASRDGGECLRHGDGEVAEVVDGDILLDGGNDLLLDGGDADTRTVLGKEDAELIKRIMKKKKKKKL